MTADDKKLELKGSTDRMFYWDEKYGWIHVYEKEKLREAYERWLIRRDRGFGMTDLRWCVTTPSFNSWVEKLFHDYSAPTVKPEEN